MNIIYYGTSAIFYNSGMMHYRWRFCISWQGPVMHHPDVVNITMTLRLIIY
ncbi:hypothetical protein GXV25_004462 [Escherichia coli]|nr:hypothetical protein [Escherichia coli]